MASSRFGQVDLEIDNATDEQFTLSRATLRTNGARYTATLNPAEPSVLRPAYHSAVSLRWDFPEPVNKIFGRHATLSLEFAQAVGRTIWSLEFTHRKPDPKAKPAVQATRSRDATYVAYSDEDCSCVFLGWLTRDRLTAAPELASHDPDASVVAAKATLERFPRGQPLQGITRHGRDTVVTVESVNPAPELGESSIDIKGQVEANSGDGVLFGTAALPLHILVSESVPLSNSADSRMRQKAQDLWAKAILERPAGERPQQFTLGQPAVQAVRESPGLMAVLYPVDFVELTGDEKEPQSHDHRGSMFFIYSESKRRIVRATFGHPEWAPGSSVQTIQPEFFFRLGRSREVLFLANSSGGWEEWGHGIFSLRTGRELLSCY